MRGHEPCVEPLRRRACRAAHRGRTGTVDFSKLFNAAALFIVRDARLALKCMRNQEVVIAAIAAFRTIVFSCDMLEGAGYRPFDSSDYGKSKTFSR